MAETQFATGNALTRKVWSAKVWRESVKDIFFNKFMGRKGYQGQMKAPDLDAIITVKQDLTKEKGDKITIPLRMRLTAEATNTESASLEGNEESMTFYDYSITLVERGHAVKAKNKMALQRPAFDLRVEFKDGLRDWLTEYLDRTTMDALSTSPTSGETVWPNDATSTGTIETADVMSTTLIATAKRTARLATPKVRPVMVGGKEYYVLLLHDFQFKAIQAESTWTQAQREAGVRGLDNPIFSGAEGVWDGVILHKYERVNTFGNWGSGSNLDGAYALLLGAQAGVQAYAQYPQWYEKMFDYGRIPGVATDLIWEAGKTVFNSKDYAVITVPTYYVSDG